MEGNYVWNTWCEKKGYPKDISELRLRRPEATEDYLDKLLEEQLQEFEKEEL